MALASAALAGDSLDPGLYVTATPIGNARDITLRALDVLRACDLIVAEDTRVTAKLLAIHGVSKPLTAYNDHNAPHERPKLLARLREGARIVLVSDAGTPLISDPGYKLVREVLAEHLPVQVVPGPSAVLAALVLAGIPADRFLFAGFLPPKPGERRRALEGLRDVPAAVVLFESSPRLRDSLADMVDVLGARPAAIARELTKVYEEVRRGDLRSLAAEFATRAAPKGEITVVVASAPKREADFAKIDKLLSKALEHMPLKSAVDLVVEAFDLPRHGIYQRALSIKAHGTN